MVYKVCDFLWVPFIEAEWLAYPNSPEAFHRHSWYPYSGFNSHVRCHIVEVQRGAY